MLRRLRGFTLIELLLVVAIAGILLAIVTPSFSDGLAGTRMQMAAQSTMHLARYARNMAVLQQQPAELLFEGGEDAVIRVRTLTKTRESATSEDNHRIGDEPAAKALSDSESRGAEGNSSDAFSVTDTDSVQKFKQLRFTVEYEDEIVNRRTRAVRRATDWRSIRRQKQRAEEALEGIENPDPVQFKSNGTCRPFRVTITDLQNEESSLVVIVDMLGVAQIEEAE